MIFLFSEANTTVITSKVPDSITSFIITAFSINPITGFAITKNPTVLSVFKPMFISMDLPYSVKVGEIVIVPVSVFNYMDDDQEADVTFYNNDSEFDFINAEEEINLHGSKGMTKKINVKNQSVNLTSFKIRPNRVGSIKINVVVTSTLSDGDGMVQYLLVKPEGSIQFKNEAVFIDLKNSRHYTTDIYVSIPPEAVYNSIKIEASIVGDVLGLPIGNVKKLM